MRLLRNTTDVIKHDVNGVPYVATIEVEPPRRTRAELWAIFREREWSQGGSELPVQAVERREEVRLLKGEK